MRMGGGRSWRGGISDAAKLHLNSIVHIACIGQGDSVPQESPVAVIAVPSTRTWSRLRRSSKTGPLPLRSSIWPWGMPTLTGRFRDEVDDANRCLRHCLSTLGIALERNFETEIILLDLEDFGRAHTGTPASVRQLSETRSLARRFSLHRSAVHQCMFGAIASPSPLGILSSSCNPLPHAKRGWPRFQISPRTVYVSPLPTRCECGFIHSERTQRRSSSSNSMLTAALVTALANTMMKNWIRVGLSRRVTVVGGRRNQDDSDRFSDMDSASPWAVESLSSEEDDLTSLRKASAGQTSLGGGVNVMLDEHTRVINTVGSESSITEYSTEVNTERTDQAVESVINTLGSENFSTQDLITVHSENMKHTDDKNEESSTSRIRV